LFMKDLLLKGVLVTKYQVSMVNMNAGTWSGFIQPKAVSTLIHKFSNNEGLVQTGINKFLMLSLA
jgi:hypothetical protein